MALVVTLALVVPAWSYGTALAAPGSAAWTTRTVDWLRDHGFSPAVDAAENWWYSLHPPSDTAPEAAELPSLTTHPLVARGVAAPALPVLTDDFFRHPLPDEDVWQPRETDSTGRLLVATAFVRPDPAHAGVVAGVAWVRQPGIVAHLVAGTTMPGGPSWPGRADVPRADVPRLVATFNSGWRMRDVAGGFRLGTQTWPALRAGQATAVIDSRGRLDVGVWGRDVGLRSDIAAARQNLALVVDGGRAVRGLDANLDHGWGYRDNQHQFTYRSGLGVDRHGDLVYVAGAKMTLPVLAQALVEAGAVRAMELDVHDSFPFFALWEHAHGKDRATKLLPTMTHGADRYLRPDQRDFFYLTTAGAGAS